jgi:hypothetical protein
MNAPIEPTPAIQMTPAQAKRVSDLLRDGYEKKEVIGDVVGVHKFQHESRFGWYHGRPLSVGPDGLAILCSA